MSDSCNIIIAFLPRKGQTVDPVLVRRLLSSHPVIIERLEETPKGILVFASSTLCQSFELTSMREQLFEEGCQAGCTIRLQRESLFKAMHSVTP